MQSNGKKRGKEAILLPVCEKADDICRGEPGAREEKYNVVGEKLLQSRARAVQTRGRDNSRGAKRGP